VAARIVGAVLAAYLLWLSASGGRILSAGSAVGWAAETAVAAAAVAIGLSVSLVDPLPGPIVAQAAGLALIALAVGPLTGRDVLRLGVGVILLVLALSMLTAAWLGSTPPLAHLAVATLLVGIAGAASVASVASGGRPSLESAGGTVTAGSPRRADRPVASGRLPTARNVRAGALRLRDRSMGLAEQTSVWGPGEETHIDMKPTATPPTAAPQLPTDHPDRSGRGSQP
jgi:hypothetical protein